MIGAVTPAPRSSDVAPLAAWSKPRLAYILAASHSGSTLLAMLLGAQQKTCTAGELKATSLGDVERYRCSCGTLLKCCSFWMQVSEAMRRRGYAFDVVNARTSIHGVSSPYARRLLDALHRGPLLEWVRDCGLNLSPQWRAHLRETQQRNQALVESLQDITGAAVVVDSSKIALRLKYLRRLPALDVRVIRLIRDGRAVALTYMDEWSFADAANPSCRGGGTGERRRNQRSMADAAHEWRRSNEAADCLTATLDRSEWTEVRYEDLCADPEETLRMLGAFLGLPTARIVTDFRAVPQHVIGNGMRFDTSSEIRLDERWKTHLTAEDLQVFDQLAGDLNRRYGYR
ncbi:MAG: sulfotransferase [Verrucomicrobia bacterium]|nr:sulfotransferase [Verrucomicrobiota bacterium]